jgi:Archaeal fructose-1,6-bisphosphatase and related enzymes of inositol monophosphatase family
LAIFDFGSGNKQRNRFSGMQPDLPSKAWLMPKFPFSECSAKIALAICPVPACRTDAHIELEIHLWDFADGKLIVEEAGGIFTDVDGKPFSR